MFIITPKYADTLYEGTLLLQIFYVVQTRATTQPWYTCNYKLSSDIERQSK